MNSLISKLGQNKLKTTLKLFKEYAQADTSTRMHEKYKVSSVSSKISRSTSPSRTGRSMQVRLTQSLWVETPDTLIITLTVEEDKAMFSYTEKIVCVD